MVMIIKKGLINAEVDIDTNAIYTFFVNTKTKKFALTPMGNEHRHCSAQELLDEGYTCNI